MVILERSESKQLDKLIPIGYQNTKYHVINQSEVLLLRKAVLRGLTADSSIRQYAAGGQASIRRPCVIKHIKTRGGRCTTDRKSHFLHNIQPGANAAITAKWPPPVIADIALVLSLTFLLSSSLYLFNLQVLIRLFYKKRACALWVFLTLNGSEGGQDLPVCFCQMFCGYDIYGFQYLANTYNAAFRGFIIKHNVFGFLKLSISISQIIKPICGMFVLI